MPDKNKTVAVVCGGPSPEADVSRIAANRLTPSLSKHYGKVVKLELDKQLPEQLVRHEVDVVFPATYGPQGEDGCLQGLLEVMGIPYIGSRPQASANALNKVTTKRLLSHLGMPLAKDLVIRASDNLERNTNNCLEQLGEKVIIKPFSQGSGIGIQFAEGYDQLKACLQESFKKDNELLIEEFIVGREITAGVLELEATQVLPVIEITTCDGAWYSYEYRYNPGMSDHIIPAPLPPEQYQRVQELTLLAHTGLGCRDISRSDFIVPSSGEPVLAELNNLPGMTPTSLFPDSARHAGIEFDDLVCRLIDHALTRHEQKTEPDYCSGYWELPELELSKSS
ncbi:D-alanine--D-alanine ligase [Endozoicomonas montiporae]|uniref:D-alanine--D-alanine ligase n=1 Tax=Endozoicomonas montiporae CL-33 TaxID=570277 RepID=A0A142BG95_9GAMM|nr:D-alanine--D-alanine ligase [Endozoicomonas montiporae]AMO57771.1 D-alanine--D-alanine ligase [Endozoicomonas montiporae CL-33]